MRDQVGWASCPPFAEAVIAAARSCQLNPALPSVRLIARAAARTSPSWSDESRASSFDRVGRPGRASSCCPPALTRSPCPLVNAHEAHRPNVEDVAFRRGHTELGEKQPLPLFGSFFRAYLLRAAPIELISRVDLPCRLIVPQNARSSHRPGVPFCEPHSITQPPPSPPARSPTPEGRSRANNDAC